MPRHVPAYCALFVLLATAAAAQEAPLTLSHPHAVRIVTGPNIIGQYVEGDVLRIGVFASRSTALTTVIATQDDQQIPLPYYSGPLLDHLYEAIVPFEPAMVGPWTITASRGAETAVITVDGPASVFAVPLIEDIRVEIADGQAMLTWTWPDLSEARAMGLSIGGDVRVMQEDNHDEYILNFGFEDEPMAIGETGERYAVAIPGGLEDDKLFLFRVYLNFYAAGQPVAQSISFAPTLYNAAGP